MSNPVRVADAGLNLIRSFENLELVAYPDPGTGGDPWTIGWGHTGPEVHAGLIWTQEQANEALASDLGRFERDVSQLVKVAINQNQFDALVSFAYNVGSDIDADTIAEGLGDSTLLKKLNAGDYDGAADEFPKWNEGGGKVLKGLVRRRAAERDLFLTPVI